MTRDELRRALLECLGRIAPEVEPGSLDPRQRLRDQVDLDSVDWMNFLVAVHAAINVDIPDVEAARLTTLDQLLDYCDRRLGIP
ncbi:MAG TPA: phosphopantetheine-binding protein [Burkholderiaceae bacterium]|nr:phosphopantetheine-binding protein [Burkholderiaceae bacterium]HQR69057.1 phosphopantetheine-binding protein [Burkholderiaceae bacterium]